MRGLKSSEMKVVLKSESNNVPLALNVLLPLFSFVVASSLVFAFLWWSPIGLLQVRIAAESSESGTSQIFFAVDSLDFSEQRSQNQRVVLGPNQLVFVVNPVRETLGSALRWDPLDRPAVVEIESLKVVGAFFSKTFDPVDVLRPSVDVSDVTTSSNGARIETFSQDGQFLLDMDLPSLYRTHVIGLVVVGVLLGLASVLALALVWRRLGRSIDGSRDVVERWGVVVAGFVLLMIIVVFVSWSLVAR